MVKTKGGQGAAEYVQSIYGNGLQQLAQLNEGNVLHAAGQPVQVKGGNCGLVHGGSAIAQVAVPAVLLVANNRFGKTKRSFKKFKMRKSVRFPKSRKFRGSRRGKR